MSIASSFFSLVGNTPLVYLKTASKLANANVWGKCEFLNPGGSIKDRAAVSILKQGIQKGEIIKDKTIVIDATAGNTGIGLALACSSLNLPCIIVIPRNQTEAKKKSIRDAGGILFEVDAFPYRNPNNYVRLTHRIVDILKSNLKDYKIFFANQFDNIDNRLAHENHTGIEIIKQFGEIEKHKVLYTDEPFNLEPIEFDHFYLDGFSCAMGTGGTIAGVAHTLKKNNNNNCFIGLTDPYGAMIANYVKNGNLSVGPFPNASSITEGIGQARITNNLYQHSKYIDFVTEISDEIVLNTISDLSKNEGLNLGLSTGVNVAGAIEFSKWLKNHHNIKRPNVVTVLCDYSDRYENKLNDEFLKSNNLPLFSRKNELPDEINRVIHMSVETARLPDDVVSLELEKYSKFGPPEELYKGIGLK